jgi:hypothetical protein
MVGSQDDFRVWLGCLCASQKLKQLFAIVESAVPSQYWTSRTYNGLFFVCLFFDAMERLKRHGQRSQGKNSSNLSSIFRSELSRLIDEFAIRGSLIKV